jgi:hypothetical protein
LPSVVKVEQIINSFLRIFLLPPLLAVGWIWNDEWRNKNVETVLGTVTLARSGKLYIPCGVWFHSCIIYENKSSSGR